MMSEVESDAGETKNVSGEVDKIMVEKLSEGLVNLYEPHLKPVKKQLLDLVKKQETVHNEMHDENLKLSEAISNDDIRDMMNKIKMYREKLLNIRKNMTALHEQSTKLKKRAIKLEQQKQKEALDKVHLRDHEEQLIAKPSTS